MSIPPLEGPVWRPARVGVVGAFVTATLAGCTLPFGLGLPTTRSLESGAAAAMTAASTFEVTGSYTEGSAHWTIDLQVQRPGAQHVVIKGATVELEAIVVGNDAYYRGQQFLSAHMGNDQISRAFVSAAANGWWKSTAAHVPQLPELTDGNLLRSTFLGQSATRRTDGVSVAGIDAVEMSGPRADVFIAAQAPYRVLRVHLKPGVAIDGIRDADFQYSHYDGDFKVAAPANVIDFSNLSTLPPVYTVLSVDTSACGSPCMVAALLKNLGGMTGAKAPSIITFTMTDVASRQAVATCNAPVVPDVGFNATTTVRCTFADLSGQHSNAFVITAVADNSGRATSTTPWAAALLSCRLPVVTSSQAGWLTFPAGSFAADPKADVRLPGYSSQPFYWKSYDKAYERWVPVPRDSISPDGQHYAYADPLAASGQPASDGVHVVDLGTGADHLFRPGVSNPVVLDYETEGVYVASQPSGPALPMGLWLLDPTGQRPVRQIDTSHAWQYINGGAAWGTTDPLTPHGPGPGSRLLRLDLKTGAIDPWVKQPDDFIVAGADGSGYPMLQPLKDSLPLWLVLSQNLTQSLRQAAGSLRPHLSNYIHPVSDPAHGLWLGDTGGAVSLYSSAGGIQLVATVGTSDVLPVGGCH